MMNLLGVQGQRFQPKRLPKFVILVGSPHISGQTVNQHYYTEVLKGLRKKIGIKGQNWKVKDDCYNNTMHPLTRPICQAVSDQQKHYCAEISSLFTIRRFLFPIVKSCLKETHFTSVEEVQEKTENLQKGLLKTSFQNSYQR
ncbi:hypothetical protein TNCV_3340581 [Trichonephila clavipes]|nr:hypothetical protein TNCV_3340581 [Trichonephila clavipes]